MLVKTQGNINLTNKIITHQLSFTIYDEKACTYINHFNEV